MPIAVQVLTPFQALTTIAIFDLIGALPMARKTVPEVDRSDVLRMIAGLIVGLPLGLFVLTQVQPEVFQYSVSFVAIAALAIFMSGVRYRGAFTPGLITTAGGLGGFLYGTAGIPGPPVILLYIASTHPIRVIRANIFVFLFFTDVVLIPTLAIFGKFDASAVLLALLLVVPTMAGITLGGRLFRPEHEKTYRAVAYAIIAAAAISGLPIWN